MEVLALNIGNVCLLFSLGEVTLSAVLTYSLNIYSLYVVYACCFIRRVSLSESAIVSWLYPYLFLMEDMGCASKFDIHSFRRSKRSGDRRGERWRLLLRAGEEGTKGVKGWGTSSSSSSNLRGINFAVLVIVFYLVGFYALKECFITPALFGYLIFICDVSIFGVPWKWGDGECLLLKAYVDSYY